MHLFRNLFAAKAPDYPPLDPQSQVGQQVSEIEDALGKLLQKVSDPLEVVPSEHAAYVFIGKPPKRFGLAWIHDGQVSGLNTLVEEHGVKPAEIEALIEQLREAYQKHQDAQHYTATIDDRAVVVTASDQLEHAVHDIMERILH